MAQIDFLREAQSLEEKLIAWRRDFHAHPEIAFEEVRTAGIVADSLRSLGMEVATGIGRTGVIGILEGQNPGPTVLVRADMDALPMQEANDVPYKSTYPGKMHACGHDGHTAIALGVAELLSRHRSKLKGRIKFVFQPAEEIGSGARAMVADGALGAPQPDVTLGLHLWNTMSLGVLGVQDGPIMAAASIFNIRIIGKGGHGALPAIAIDPIVCASHMVLAMQTIVSRNVSGQDQAVVSVTTIHSGTATNIIPAEATLSGTFRTFTTEIRDLVERRIREIATHVAATFGCQVEVEIEHYTRAVSNDPETAERVRQVFQKLGYDQFVNEQTMGAEDVGEFMTDIPGMFFFLGSADESRELNYPHHHPRFDFDEAVLPLGTALLAAAVADYVMPDALE